MNLSLAVLLFENIFSAVVQNYQAKEGEGFSPFSMRNRRDYSHSSPLRLPSMSKRSYVYSVIRLRLFSESSCAETNALGSSPAMYSLTPRPRYVPDEVSKVRPLRQITEVNSWL